MKFYKLIILPALILVVFCGGTFIRPYAEESDLKRLVVIGVRNEINKPEWDNQLIGYGLSNLLLQKLFDTGRYIAIEDNPEILDQIDTLIRTQWQGQASYYSAKDADRIGADLGGDAVAYAKVTKFSTRRKRGFAGPFSGANTRVIVELEISLKEKGLPVKVARGKGDASTKSMGTFFIIREDKVYFDETTVGKAAHEAITDAIDKMKL